MRFSLKVILLSAALSVVVNSDHQASQAHQHAPIVGRRCNPSHVQCLLGTFEKNLLREKATAYLNVISVQGKRNLENLKRDFKFKTRSNKSIKRNRIETRRSMKQLTHRTSRHILEDNNIRKTNKLTGLTDMKHNLDNNPSDKKTLFLKSRLGNQPIYRGSVIKMTRNHELSTTNKYRLSGIVKTSATDLKLYSSPSIVNTLNREHSSGIEPGPRNRRKRSLFENEKRESLATRIRMAHVLRNYQQLKKVIEHRKLHGKNAYTNRRWG